MALIALALLGGGAARTLLSPMQELMRVDLSMSDNQVSLVQGAALALPFAMISVFVGRLVDSSSRSRLLIVFSLLAAAGTALTGLAHSFGLILLARALVGISFGGGALAALSLVADISDATNRSRVVGLLSFGQLVGTACAFIVPGILLGKLQPALEVGLGLPSLAAWRLVQLLFAAALVLQALALLLLTEPARQGVREELKVGTFKAWRELTRYRHVLLPLLIGMLTVGMADTAAGIWAAPVLTRALHLQPADFGAWMGLLLMGSGLAGVIVGGLLGDAGQRLAGSYGALGAVALVTVLSIPAACFPLMSSARSFAALLGMLIVSGTASGVIGNAAITTLIPNELRGLTFSISATLNAVIAFGVAPTLVSLVAQVTGFGTDIRIPLTVVGVVTISVGTISYLLAMRAARQSVAAAAMTNAHI
jgi:MFS family permease